LKSEWIVEESHALSLGISHRGMRCGTEAPCIFGAEEAQLSATVSSAAGRHR
jgi:hypothetical protein